MEKLELLKTDGNDVQTYSDHLGPFKKVALGLFITCALLVTPSAIMAAVQETFWLFGSELNWIGFALLFGFVGVFSGLYCWASEFSKFQYRYYARQIESKRQESKFWFKELRILRYGATLQINALINEFNDHLDRLEHSKSEPGEREQMAHQAISELLESFGYSSGLIHGGELHHCCSARRRESQNLRCGNEFCWIDQLGHLTHPDAMRAAVHAFPDVKFVIAHMANPHFEALRALMRDCPNVVTDISGQFVSGTHEDTPEYREEVVGEIMRFIREVPRGKWRIMFGSDFPIQSFEASIDLVEALSVSDETKANIYRHNALRVYPHLAH